MAAGTKRGLEESVTTRKAKKSRVEDKQAKSRGKDKSDKLPAPASNLVQDEVDFPRGGGTSFTPLEVKAIRAEAVKEANEELFNVRRALSLVLSDSSIRMAGKGQTG